MKACSNLTTFIVDKDLAMLNAMADIQKKKAMKVSNVAKGRMAKVLVYRGSKARTGAGL